MMVFMRGIKHLHLLLKGTIINAYVKKI